MKLTRWRTGVAPVMALVLGSVIVLVAACDSTPEPATNEETSTTPASTPVTPAVSINALMVSSIDHAAHEIWDAAAEPPKTEQEWQELDYHAIQLAALGTMITVGGTGPADAGWVGLPDWQRYSQQMTDAGVAARRAAEAKDVAAISSVGDTLVMVCENCHEQFKPDSPTEGLTHQPEYPR